MNSARPRAPGRSAFGAAALAAGVFVFSAACAAAADEVAADPFWTKREKAYRDDPRGPFTAIRADYLKPGESLVLVADARSIGPDAPEDRTLEVSPPRRIGPSGAAIRITFDEADAFRAERVEGYEKPRVAEDRFDGPRVIDSDADLRLGRFLLSVDVQAADVGRVLSYDPALLAERFHGFEVFPASQRYRVVAAARAAEGDTVVVGTSRGLEKRLVRAAVLEFAIDGAPCRLVGLREPGDAGALFVPFRDATSGSESYGVGRYLRVEWEDGAAEAVVDFNHATNPWCAYSPYYNCVLPPRENEMTAAIRAGEKAPADAAH